MGFKDPRLTFTAMLLGTKLDWHEDIAKSEPWLLIHRVALRKYGNSGLQISFTTNQP